MNPATKREKIKVGQAVGVVLKKDQRTGKITSGIVTSILTNSPTHPHGIKVKLEDGKVMAYRARVQLSFKYGSE